MTGTIHQPSRAKNWRSGSQTALATFWGKDPLSSRFTAPAAGSFMKKTRKAEIAIAAAIARKATFQLAHWDMASPRAEVR